MHGVVAPSTFRSQNVQNTPGSEHFWKLRRAESARCCGAKHISKSKVLKTGGPRALCEVGMWNCVAGARDSAPEQNVRFCSSFKNVGKRGTFQEDLPAKMHVAWQAQHFV